MRHSVDVHVHETLWRTGRKKENQIDDLSDQTLLLLYQTSPEVYQTCPRNQRRSRYCRVREIGASKPEENATTIPLSNSERQEGVCEYASDDSKIIWWLSRDVCANKGGIFIRCKRVYRVIK